MTEISIEGAQPRHQAAEAIDSRFATGVEPETPTPPEPPQAPPPVQNPYAPTHWGRKQYVEYDVTTPSGQLCRVRRLERSDLISLNLLQYLDTFTPMLVDQGMTDSEREAEIREAVQEKPESMGKMLTAIDKIVLAATVKPRVTEDPKKVNYGTPQDWVNQNFTATVLLKDIDVFDRMFIFGAAFGRSMDDLKSVLQQASGVASVADGSIVPQQAE